MTELNTFGAILSYAIALEGQLQGYYLDMGDERRAREAEKRKKKLERVRREHVVEITLEPIEGLHVDDYALNLEDKSAEGQRAVAEIAARFYADVAPKINVREARRALEKCGKQHQASLN